MNIIQKKKARLAERNNKMAKHRLLWKDVKGVLHHSQFVQRTWLPQAEPKQSLLTSKTIINERNIK